ncbi:MAG: M23 family metallopeptidase [Paracoccaceae bacterium]
MFKPLECNLGEDQRCFIQSFPDRDETEGFRDFTCNGLSYDGHKGTDFALRSHLDIQNNIPVIAAADGIVKGTRDGMVDKVYTSEHATEIAGRDCGNGLVIDHGRGWETQYCHLKRGSLSVASGQSVKKGTRLGYVGMSGRAAFPHLHLSVRKNGQTVDPFAPTRQHTCNSEPKSLWADTLEYQPGGLVSVGFSDHVPTYFDVKSGVAAQTDFSTTSKALVFWALGFGARPGDQMRLTISSESGDQILTKTLELSKAQAQFFRAAGRKTNRADWFGAGDYVGIAQFIRNNEIISDADISITVTD